MDKINLFERILFHIYGIIKLKKIRKIIEKIAIKLCKNGEFESHLIRKIYHHYYNITVGFGTYGCFDSSRFRPGIVVGNYCSFGPNVYRFNANHPIDFLSTHPYFYDDNYGWVKKNKLKKSKLIIGDDVWIGANAIILPSCTKIGNGAIIGAGSVVTKNIPDYSIWAGNPAHEIRKRFDNDTIYYLNTRNIFSKQKV